MVSLVDIQGTWLEQKTKTIWIVDGITARKARRRATHHVLTDSGDGVEWEDGTLHATLEGNVLLWRSKRGSKRGGIFYTWTREEAVPPAPTTAVQTKDQRSDAETP